jgi:hypothetical protein
MNLKAWVVTGIASLLIGGPAWAAEGLTWKWTEDQTRRFYIQAQIQLAEVMVFRATNNTDVRITELQLNINTNCKAVAPVGKRGWELDCSFDDFAIQGAPIATEKGRLLPVLDEVDAYMKEASVQLVMLNDGRLRSLDLEGIVKRNTRTVDMHETLRLVLTRAFSVLDLELPSKGEDKGKAWRQTGSRVAEFPSNKGTFGLVEINHAVKETQGNKVTIESTGRGTIGGGEMIMLGDQERPKNMYDTNVRSTAAFNTGRGELLEREVLVQATPTASSVASEAGSGPAFVQAIRLVTVAPSAKVPAFGPNAELE